MKRKIIQISTTIASSFGMTPKLLVYALCDDGTLWVRPSWDKRDKEVWSKIEAIPQD